MNTKRKADLQRKLSLAPVPRPPAGLADRIKNDIPEYLRPETDRRRFSRSVAFNLRIAASVLIVISAAIAAIYLLTPEEQLMQMASKAEPPITRQLEDKVQAATDQVEVEITQSTPVEESPVMQIADATAAEQPMTLSRAVRREQDAPAVVVGETAPAPSMADAAPPAAEPAPVPPPPPAADFPMTTPEPVAQRITVTAEAPKAAAESRPAGRLTAPSLVPEAHAAEPERVRRDNVFGISIDPSVFHRIKETLESNRRPTASAVNVEALINYFAGAPARPPRRGVRLEVEGSPSPVGGGANHGFLRFTVDTATADSQLPLGADATLTIDVNGKVVARADAIGDSTTLTPESALLHNVSVTGLYDLTLRPNLRASDRVATVRLTYTRASDGKKQTIEKVVFARDFARTWTRASRRHRLASLGAVWGESLKLKAPAPEVVKRAEELATQEPRDERAQELATAATASSKLTNGF